MQAKPVRLSTLTRWIDPAGAPAADADDRVDWLRCLPFIGIHLSCAAAFWTGVSPAALAIASLIWNLRPVPAHVLSRNLVSGAERRP